MTKLFKSLLDLPGPTWTYLDLLRPIWTYLDLLRPTWTYLDLPGPTLSGTPGFNNFQSCFYHNNVTFSTQFRPHSPQKLGLLLDDDSHGGGRERLGLGFLLCSSIFYLILEGSNVFISRNSSITLYSFLIGVKAERLPNVTNVPKNTLVPQFDFIQSS